MLADPPRAAADGPWRLRRRDRSGPRLLRRLAQLYVGLTLYGVSSGLMLLSGLGNQPWTVFHQGLAIQTGIGPGYWTDIVGALLLLVWIPLRQRPGLGTISNVVVIGLVLEVTVTAFHQPHGLAPRIALLVAGIVANGFSIGLYIGARFGPGPRDGLMIGLHALTGRSLRTVRTGLELTVLAAGIALGGTAGIGTILYALAVGPLAQVFIPRFTVSSISETTRSGASNIGMCPQSSSMTTRA